MILPYRVPAVLPGRQAPSRERRVDWSWVALRVATLACGFVAVPALVTRLALEDHSVLPGIFLSYGVFAGGSLALLIVAVASPSRR